jgi:hypothetical protein
MQRDQRRQAERRIQAGPAALCWRRNWTREALCLAALAALAGIASIGQQAEPPQHAPHPILLPEANRPPDANDQMEMRDQQDQGKTKDYAAANQERKKQIVDDSARLLKLAADLKAAVDKSNKDTLSLDVIRKADEIERLAHSVKEKMKLSAGAS